jgi:uncharacterized protein YdiU (UPF0061 family)
VADRQAALIAKWMHVGFIHGVMNTDNMAISGETIDYGPCAFMNAYDPNTVFSSIDSGGRYAYANQPGIAQWNLARLAESLLTLIDADEEKAVAAAMEVLNAFPATYERYWLAGMRAKLGLRTADAGDGELVKGLLAWMHETTADFTNTFRDLGSPELLTGERYRGEAFKAWRAKWAARLAGEGDPATAFARMNAVNPAYIARNHRVEEVLSAAERDDFAPLHELLEVLASPFTTKPERAKYTLPPADDRGFQTFCGT